MSLGNLKGKQHGHETPTSLSIPSRFKTLACMDSLSFCRCRSFSADSELPKRTPQDNATECVAGEHQLAGEGTGVRRTHQRQDGRGNGWPIGGQIIALIALIALTLLGFWQVWYKLGKAQLENGSVRRLV
jgi:hypothetical protein